MGDDILQSILGELSHLLIPPSRIVLENGVEIGVGGYGHVFLAVLRYSDSQTKVAVKELRIPQAEEVRRLVAIRLAREFKVWAQAKHRNIVELLGFCLSDDYLCARFVSAYMANGNVKEYINKFKPNLATRLGFVQGITSGMSYLHKCSPAICHGDLKPPNVLVNENLDAVLCDFGLARFIMESGVSSDLTTTKTRKGTTRYMSPELLDDEGKHTLESDVWAWACTTFEVLTNCAPFPEAKQERAVVTALVLGRRPGSVGLLDGLVSDGLITYRLTLDSLKFIIPDCWITDPAKRPSSSEILDRLIFPDGTEALDNVTASFHLSATEYRQPEPFPPPSTDLPMHNDVKKKRKGSPTLEGRLEKRARDKDATIESEAIRMHKGYGEGVILMDGHESNVDCCQWNPLKRDVLATGSRDGEVLLWNVPIPPAPLLDPLVIKHHLDKGDECEISSIEWNCTGARLAITCSHGILRIWTVEGVLQSKLKYSAESLSRARWSPSGQFLAMPYEDGEVVVWDMGTAKRDKLYQVFEFHEGFVYDVLWVDGETLISGGSDGQIHIWRLHEETPLRTFTSHDDRIIKLRLSKDKTLLASAGSDFTIRVWNMDAIETGAPVQSSTGQTDPAQKWVLKGHTEWLTSLGWCPSLDPAMQCLLVSTSRDNTSRIWDARNGSCIKELLDHRSWMSAHAFSPLGRYLATGSWEGRVLIYASATGTLLFEWDCQSGIVHDIQWQSAGDQLAACFGNGGVAILDTKKMGFGDYVAP